MSILCGYAAGFLELGILMGTSVQFVCGHNMNAYGITVRIRRQGLKTQGGGIRSRF